MDVEWNYPACLRCQRQVGNVQEIMLLPCYHDVVCGECSGSPCDCTRGCSSQGYYYKSNELTQINIELWNPSNRYYGTRKRYSDYLVFLARCLRERKTIPGLEKVEVATAQMVDVPSVKQLSPILWNEDNGFCEACEQPLPPNQFRCGSCHKVSFGRFSALHSEEASKVAETIAKINQNFPPYRPLT